MQYHTKMSYLPQLPQVRDVLAEGECHAHATQQLSVPKAARTDLVLVPKESPSYGKSNTTA